jgi:hypothetical protein
LVGGGSLFRKAGLFPLYEIDDLDSGRALSWGRNDGRHPIILSSGSRRGVEVANQQSGQGVQKFIGDQLSNEVAKLAIARIKNKAEAAYRRGPFLRNVGN